MEGDEGRQLESPVGVDRATLLKRLGLGSAALSVSALLGTSDALGGGVTEAGGGGDYPSHPKWKFVFVNHLTTNPFFVATQFGAADAAALVNVSFDWTGSARGDVGEMLGALSSAITTKADGIAVAVIDKVAFEEPIKRALSRGIPVVSYNADGARSGPKARLAYIGQDMFASGRKMGEEIVQLVPKGDVALFIAAPGSLNMQPRLDGVMDTITKSGRPINAVTIATGSDVKEEFAQIEAYYLKKKTLKGMFAVDAGDTQSVGQVIQKHGLRDRVKGGGFDILPTILRLIDSRHLLFTIDQQPYLQGFLPVMHLFLFKLSGGLVKPSDTDTGLVFVTKDNVKGYLTTKTRYQGSSTKQKYPVS